MLCMFIELFSFNNVSDYERSSLFIFADSPDAFPLQNLTCDIIIRSETETDIEKEKLTNLFQ